MNARFSAKPAPSAGARAAEDEPPTDAAMRMSLLRAGKYTTASDAVVTLRGEGGGAAPDEENVTGATGAAA